MTAFVVIETSFEALHRWEGARGKEVYLAHDHRHMFVVQLKIQVRHNDREIEINSAKRWLDSFLSDLGNPGPLRKLGNMSCEEIASTIILSAKEQFGEGRTMVCKVLEDGYLGAEVAD